MKKILVTVTIFIITSTNSFAVKLFCKDPSNLYNQTEDCEDNVVFASAAIECLEGLEKSVEQAKKSLDKTLIKPDETKQRKSYDQSEANYGMTKDTLDVLLAQAKASRKEVDSYLDTIVLPEDFDEDEVVGDDVEGFLAEEPCYTENREVIKHVLEDFDNHIQSLSSASFASFDKKTTSGDSAGNSESLTSGVKSGRAQGSVNLKGQKGPHKASDISGTEEKKKK